MTAPQVGLVGYTCPAGAPTAGERNTLEHCVSPTGCPHKCVSPPLLIAMWEAEHRNHHVGSYLSASSLASFGCARQTFFERNFPFYETPRRRFWPYRGTVIHGLIEHGGAAAAKHGWMQELRMSVPIHYPDLPAPVFDEHGAWTGDFDSTRHLVIELGGTTDGNNYLIRELHDYKSMSELKVKSFLDGKDGGKYSRTIKDSWVWQTNIYGWMIARTTVASMLPWFERHGVTPPPGEFLPKPERLRIQLISMMELPLTGTTYVPMRAKELYEVDDVPVLPDEEVTAFVRERALEWFRWLVLRVQPPVVPEEDAWLCVGPDTPVLARRGYVPISDIQIGEEVLTRGGYRRVTDVMRRRAGHKKVFRVKPYYAEPLVVTSDHPILVKLYDNIDQEARRVGEPVWRTVDELLQRASTQLPDRRFGTERMRRCGPRIPKMLLSFRAEERPLPAGMTDAHLRLLGAFVAEGNLARPKGDGTFYQVYFTLGVHERRFARDILADVRTAFGVHATARMMRHRDTRSRRITVYGKDVAAWFGRWVDGRRAPVKRLNDEVSWWPRDKQWIMLEAMHRGDGALVKTRGKLVWSYATSSRRLAHQVQEIAFRLSIPAAITVSVSKGRGFSKLGALSYRITWHPQGQFSKGKFVPGASLIEVPIQYIQAVPDYQGDLWDISVDGDPEFVTSSGIVHNCKNCQFNGELIAGERCRPEAERANLAMGDDERPARLAAGGYGEAA